jgi:hypothetical protein
MELDSVTLKRIGFFCSPNFFPHGGKTLKFPGVPGLRFIGCLPGTTRYHMPIGLSVVPGTTRYHMPIGLSVVHGGTTVVTTSDRPRTVTRMLTVTLRLPLIRK